MTMYVNNPNHMMEAYERVRTLRHELLCEIENTISSDGTLADCHVQLALTALGQAQTHFRMAALHTAKF